MDKTTEKKSFLKRLEDMTSKSLLMGIFIALLILITITLVRILPTIASNASASLASTLSSIFTPDSDAKASVSARIVDLNEDFVVTFKGGDSSNGLYRISYDCAASASLSAKNGNSLVSIPCGEPYYVLGQSKTVSLRITPLTDERLIRVPLTAEFENQDTNKVEELNKFTITLKNYTEEVSTPVVTPTKPSTTNNNSIGNQIRNLTNFGGTTNANTNYVNSTTGSDLTVQLSGLGVLNKFTNTFITASSFNYTDRVGVKFVVKNDGYAATGPWSFSATLPSDTTPRYTSPVQQSLNPGDSIEFTLGFENINSAVANAISITLDPNNQVREVAETNNTVTQAVSTLNNNYYPSGSYTGGTANFEATCYGTVSSDRTVTWTAYAYNGNGSYSYYWTGSDNLVAYGPTISKSYTSGVKYAIVNITSNGQTLSRSCTVTVPDITTSADLSVRVIGVGTIGSNNQFVSQSYVARGQTAAIQIEVSNIGGTASGNWNYSVALTPSASAAQTGTITSLNPGDKTIVTVTFGNVQSYGTNYFSATVDPNNYLYDNNRSNNTISQSLNIY